MSLEETIVYYAPLTDGDDAKKVRQAIRSLYEAAGVDRFIQPKDTVAIKTHFGEKGNVTFLKPETIRTLVDAVKKSGGRPYLTETSVLYKSRRSNALDHILLAFEHGFTFERIGAPIIMSDGFLGNWEREIEIGGEFYDQVSVAGDIIAPDKLMLVSHVTGHLLSGMGGAFKNLGMGLSSRKGKLDQHSQVAPSVKTELCDFCGLCMKWCPEDAIIEQAEKAFIQADKCIGCGECLTVCKPGAVTFKWDATSEMLQKKMVEHACGVYREKKNELVFFNFLMNMTKDCDCMASKEKMIGDLGILVSYDPVAIEQATLDLTERSYQENISKLAFPELDPMIQVRHAIKMGMGNPQYRLVTV
jgi:uncharacterized protein